MAVFQFHQNVRRSSNAVPSFEAVALAFAFLILCAYFRTASAQSTIRVPQDYPTIQAAINAAVSGDTIIVAPGVYLENIDFIGKEITVASERGANVTIIDGNRSGPVIVFENRESAASKLVGFTIQNGDTSSSGGGIRIKNASPVIRENIIAGNRAGTGGHGLDFVADSVLDGSPLIQRNLIAANTWQMCCSDAGVAVKGGSPQILDNVIAGHDKGGIFVWTGTPLIQGNVVTGNVGANGGISLEQATDALVVQNVIFGNRNPNGGGGGISLASASGSRVINNTIVDNDSPSASGISEAQRLTATQHRILNNMIVAKEGQTAFDCYPQNASEIQDNNIYAPSGNAFSGPCNDPSRSSANISAPPLFLDPTQGDYRLRVGSASIDAGSNQAAGIPPLDFDGYARIIDGDANGSAIIDLGAYEHGGAPPKLTVTLSSSDFGTFFVGAASVTQTATISNTSSSSWTVAFVAAYGEDTSSFAVSIGGAAACPSLSPTLAPGESCTFLLRFTPALPGGTKRVALVAMPKDAGSPAFTMASATVLVPDPTPSPFSFVDQIGVARGSVVTSNTVTVTGLFGPIPISITNGTYSINGGAFTAIPGTIEDGQSVAIRVTAPTTELGTTIATLTIGTASGQFRATTQSLGTYYYPLAIGNSWTRSRDGVVGPASVVTGTAIVDNVRMLVLVDGFDGTERYFTNDFFGLRLHRTRTPQFPPQFPSPCGGTYYVVDSYRDSPMTIIPGEGTIGDIKGSMGHVDLGPLCQGIRPMFDQHTTTSTLEAFERVNVPAGPFDTLRVRVTTSTINDTPQSFTLWLAPGVGPVRILNANGTIEELVSTNVQRVTPNPFAFQAPSNAVKTNSMVTSSPATIVGITAAAAVSITGGEYSINGGAFTSQPGSVSNGQSIRVRLISPTKTLTEAVATLTVGGVSTPFRLFTGRYLPPALLAPILELLLMD